MIRQQTREVSVCITEVASNRVGPLAFLALSQHSVCCPRDLSLLCLTGARSRVCSPLLYVDCSPVDPDSLCHMNALIFQSLVSSIWVSFCWLPKPFQGDTINFYFHMSHLHFAYPAALLQSLSIIKEYFVLP